MTGESPYTIAAAHIRFAVRLTPKGGRDAVDGWAMGADSRQYLKARVSAAPEDGKANAALLALLAKQLGVAKSCVRIVSGETARLKLVEVEGNTAGLAKQLDQLERRE